MPHGTKIATCHYCGTRAALVLRGEIRHELSCASCGAPLHDLKRLPSEAGAHHSENPRLPARHGREAVSARAEVRGETRRVNRPKKSPTKVRRRKPLAWRMLEEAFDAIEDIFD